MSFGCKAQDEVNKFVKSVMTVSIVVLKWKIHLILCSVLTLMTSTWYCQLECIEM